MYEPTIGGSGTGCIVPDHGTFIGVVIGSFKLRAWRMGVRGGEVAVVCGWLMVLHDSACYVSSIMRNARVVRT